MLGKKLIRFDVGDPARPDITEFVKLSLVITVSMFTKDWLVKQKITPDYIPDLYQAKIVRNLNE